MASLCLDNLANQTPKKDHEQHAHETQACKQTASDGGGSFCSDMRCACVHVCLFTISGR